MQTFFCGRSDESKKSPDFSVGAFVKTGVTDDYFHPNFLRISFGMALRLTMMSIVLYSTNGREKYQYPS